MEKNILAPFDALGGEVGFYFENLVTGESFEHNGDVPLLAASVIKLTVMAEAFHQLETGIARREERFVIRAQDKLPICGALTGMHDGLEVTLMDLVWLMIVFSDNTATNMLIDRLGIERINAFIEENRLKGVRLNRKLFDAEASARGIENYVSAAGIGRLLKLIYTGELVSKDASGEMLDILFDQQLNGKLPLSLPREVRVAHKTGEDEGITHDVGIVEASYPYIICVLSNGVDEPAFDMAIHAVSRAVYDYVERSE